jgi:hypothetical protein
MPRNNNLYHLFGANKRPLYIDATGTLQEADDNWNKLDGQPAILKDSPVGWVDTLIKYARNLKYWGLFREMTAPMEFPGDGGEILKKLFWLKGVEAICYLGISKLHPTILPYEYNGWYFSEINFSKFRQNGITVKCEALEGGMSKVLKAFENTTFEIPIDTDEQHVNVLFDGVALKGSHVWTLGGFYSSDEGAGGGKEWIFGAIQLGEEGRAVGVTYSDAIPEQMAADGDHQPFFNYLGTSLNYVAAADESNSGPINVQFKGSLKLQLTTKRDTFNIRVRLLRVHQPWNPPSTPTNPQYYPIYAPGEGVGTYFTTEGEVKDIPFDITIAMQPGDKVFTYLQIIPTSFEDTSDFTILDGEMSSEFINKYRPTYVKGLYAYRVFEQLVKKMVGSSFIISQDNVYTKSNWLSTKKDLVITSGDALRGIITTETQRGAVIKTNLSDFFKSMGHFGVGLGIEGEKIVIELFNYFFQNTIIADIGEVSETELWYAEDLGFNTIKAGGPEVDYDDINGRYETNQEVQYTTPVTKVIKELDLTTPYRRDPIGMEFLRINLDGKKTTDSDSDNDVFMVNVETSANVDEENDITYYKLNRPAYSVCLGVLDPVGIFNLEYSPGRTIRNNGSMIASILDLMDDGYIKFSSSLKNRDLKTTGGPFVVTIDEDADISIGGVGAKTFRPIYLKFTAPIPVHLQEQLEVNKYGKLKYTVKGKPYYIYMSDGGVKPALNDKYVFTGISVPENDLQNYNKNG